MATVSINTSVVLVTLFLILVIVIVNPLNPIVHF